jgi:hypothetical protein
MSQKEQAVRVIIGLPQYLWSWVWGLVLVIFSDTTVTTLAVTALIAGLVLESVLGGLLVFFALYSAARMVISVANAIGNGLNALANVYAALNSPSTGLEDD